jgi:ribose transport system permease protein
MTRILGVLGLLLVLYAALIASHPNAGGTDNLIGVANLQGRFGVITLGAALVIIIGGIDLSVGAVVGCGAILFGVLMNDGVHPFVALPAVVLFGAAIGLANGQLITRLKLQPFLVTLCGMFVFRGAARLIAQPVGGTLGMSSVIAVRPEYNDSLRALRYWLIGKAPADGELLFPAQFVLLLALAALVGFFLHRTAYGRYWYAIGHSELAAKYAGVNVDRQRVVVYVVCSALAAFTGVLLFLDSPSVQSDNAGWGGSCTRSSARCSAGAASAAARARRWGWCWARWCCR